jgi:hypothetical protein
MTVAKSTAGGYQRVTSSGLNTSGKIASAITEGTVTPRRRMITIVMAETSATPTKPGANVLAPNVPIAAPTVGAITPPAPSGVRADRGGEQFVGYGAHRRKQQKAQVFILGEELNGPQC